MSSLEDLATTIIKSKGIFSVHLSFRWAGLFFILSNNNNKMCTYFVLFCFFSPTHLQNAPLMDSLFGGGHSQELNPEYVTCRGGHHFLFVYVNKKTS